MPDSPWIAYANEFESAALRLFCFPHAGGGASSYRAWVAGLAPEIAVLPVQLPGRETRFMERPFTDLAELLLRLEEELAPFLDKPFAFFGHSLGALVGFELARRLTERNIFPQHLFVSGYGAPHLPLVLPPTSHLDNDQFVTALGELNTVPTAVLQNRELLEVLMPMLRADFTIYEQYRFAETVTLPCPITVLGGEADQLVSPEMLAEWTQHTDQHFQVHLMPGDHFYLQEQQTAVWRIVQQRCLIQQPSS